jgi:5'-3' exonuclease
MKQPILLIDGMYLAYMAYHSMPKDMFYNEQPTGVIFGFLDKVLSLAMKFSNNNIVICWDSRHSIRSLDYPPYKRKRKEKREKDPEEQYEHVLLHDQVHKLRTEILPNMGFRNVFVQKGLEGDDLVAKLIIDYPKETFVLIASDHDLYQLLQYDNLKYIWAPSPYKNQPDRRTTKRSFCDTYGIHPRKWGRVKAIAGCTTDNVEGIKGVGEKTAIKYIRKELKSNSKAFNDIRAGKKIIRRNKPLVILPHAKTKSINLRKNKFSWEKFEPVFEQYGFASFLIGKRNKWEAFIEGKSEERDTFIKIKPKVGRRR